MKFGGAMFFTDYSMTGPELAVALEDVGVRGSGVFSDGQRAQGFIASAGRGFAHGHLFRTGTPSFARVVRLFGIQASAAPAAVKVEGGENGRTNRQRLEGDQRPHASNPGRAISISPTMPAMCRSRLDSRIRWR
jgi:hypothetical protein